MLAKSGTPALFQLHSSPSCPVLPSVVSVTQPSQSCMYPEEAKPICSRGSKISQKPLEDLPLSLIGLNWTTCPFFFQSLELKESHVLTDLGLGRG